MQYCACYKPMTIKKALKAIWEESIEFMQEPTKDELSDIMYGIGRLLAAFIKKTYIPMPFDKHHIAKMDKRMQQHNCVRSARHLKRGKCPSL